MLNFLHKTNQFKSKLFFFLKINNYSLSKGLAFDRVIHWRRPHEFMEVDGLRGLFDPVLYSSQNFLNIVQG